MRASARKAQPTIAQTAILRRIAQTGGLMLTKTPDGDHFSDRAGKSIDEREALTIIRRGWVAPERDSMFDLEPQSWKAKTPA